MPSYEESNQMNKRTPFISPGRLYVQHILFDIISILVQTKPHSHFCIKGYRFRPHASVYICVYMKCTRNKRTDRRVTLFSLFYSRQPLENHTVTIWRLKQSAVGHAKREIIAGIEQNLQNLCKRRKKKAKVGKGRISSFRDEMMWKWG